MHAILIRNLEMVVGLLKKITGSKLLLSFGSLSSCTAFAQLLQLLNFVVLAKYYSIESVGEYGVFLAIVHILPPVMLLSYEGLIPNQDDKSLPAYISDLLVILSCTAMSVYGIASFIGYAPAFPMVLWVVGIALYRIAEMMNIRASRFFWVGGGRILLALQTVGVLFYAITSGLSGIKNLIDYQAIGVVLFGSSYLLFTLAWSARCRLEKPAFGLLSGVNSNAPRWMMPSSLLNVASYNIPVVAIEQYFGAGMAAQYAYVLRFGFGPVGLIGSTLHQISYANLAAARRDNDRSGYQSFLNTRGVVFWISIFFTVLASITFPIAFYYLLGAEWFDAGVISAIFSPLFGIMIYCNALSSSLYVFGEQVHELKSQVFYFFVSFISFSFAVFFENLWLGFVLFCLLGSLRYLLLIKDIDFVINKYIL